jgi:tetratricopeptide (TPR) repeat protein
MADIFISYTKSDRDWAFWIGQELQELGHTPRIHEWEISGGGNIPAWMEERHHDADHILCVISKEYLTKPYSSWERLAAQWAAANDRPNFALPVFVERCEAPTLLAHIKRCDLFDLDEGEARERLKNFLAPAAKPARATDFPGGKPRPAAPAPHASVAFPGRAPAAARDALSNIAITVPRHFLGRDADLAAIDTAFAGDKGPVAITALHGLRGVGKTTLAAAYAERHRGDYRATWWIRAQTADGMRADLVGLGVRLGWVAADEKEEPALAAVIEQLRHAGEGLLLIYDNAVDADAVKPYLPLGGAARVLVTSNSPTWRRVASPLEIALWPKEIGADYLVARTGRAAERRAAEALSEALGGLPLAHEQAGAYCERLEISLAEYRRRFAAAPEKMLDSTRDAPADYHDRLTVAKTFALAIEEAARLHPAAEPLIVHAALLAPEPIPLFLFAEAREKFGEPLASALAGDGLDEALAALRAFALIDRESIADERDPAITTDCLRLHRLVRQVAAARHEGDARAAATRVLIAAIASVRPTYIWRDPVAWPRTRRLDALALALLDGDTALLKGADTAAADLLMMAGQYRHFALVAYPAARPLYERALAIREKVLGPQHADTAGSLNELAGLLQDQGDLAGARPLFERALAISEKVDGPEHPSTARSLGNLALLLQQQGDLAGARPLYERALAICEKVRGREHPDTATSLNNLALLLHTQGDLAGARPLYERALAIDEKVLGPKHPQTATDLGNLAGLLQDQGDHAGARPLVERALAIDEKVLGPEHPDTNLVRSNLAHLLFVGGNAGEALALSEVALAAHDKVLGPHHPWTKHSASVNANALDALGRAEEAKALRTRFGLDEPAE